MKKRRTLALLMAGILTASALSIGASAADADVDTAPEAGIAQEETIREKKTKESTDSTTEDSMVKEKKTKKSSDSASEDGTVTKKNVKKSSDSASETGTARKKHSNVSSKTAEPEGAIGKDAAKEAALADAGTQAEGHVRGRYTEKDGTGIYKVTFKAGGQKYKYRIDAMTGEILEKNVTEITE